MKTNSIVVLILFCIIFTSYVNAIPQIPTVYYGVVSEDGGPLPGKEVIVKDSLGNNVYSTDLISDADGIYKANVLWDDSETIEDEGVSEGEKISFYINGNKIKDLTVGAKGAFIENDLAITGEEISSPLFERPKNRNGEISQNDADEEGVAGNQIDDTGQASNPTQPDNVDLLQPPESEGSGQKTTDNSNSNVNAIISEKELEKIAEDNKKVGQLGNILVIAGIVIVLLIAIIYVIGIFSKKRAEK
ncbi:MAG: hypothetical protein V1859_10915 [archaeon]